ncbi:oxidase ustYa family protein [Aspergillus alliaceus]|nr:uncharacterized protein BDW43DRAFT_313196 [Aspergillus alliaceus]KAB8231387.1 hypothetical protein BDW43DRAFT_313196 [Aspergillus alliaceus]
MTLNHPVSGDSSALSLSFLQQKGIPVPSSPQSGNRLNWILHSLALCISLGLTVIALTMKPSTLQCTRQLSPYSPLIQEGIVKYESKNFENEFDQPSIYRGPPSEGTEEAWKALWETPAISVPEEKLAVLNKSDPRGQGWLPVPPVTGHEGGGEFAALVEVFHQLHCINTLRLEVHKESYFAHFGEWPDGSGPGNEIVKGTHLDHCIELLRITLMCVSDVTPLMFIDDPQAFQGGTPDFNTMHTCRNFWGIRKMVEEIGLPPLP